jgi:hypothetical protein
VYECEVGEGKGCWQGFGMAVFMAVRFSLGRI